MTETQTSQSKLSGMESSHQRLSVLACILVIGCFVVLRKDVFALLAFSRNSDSASHLLFMPVVSLYLLYSERSRIFARATPNLPGGIALACIGIGMKLRELAHPSLSVGISSLMLLCIAVFVGCYGIQFIWKARIAVLFLLLTIPPTPSMLDRCVRWLQNGSAALAEALFSVANIPVFREGVLLQLPHLSIEVARECSGIRSSIALLLTATIAAHYLLASDLKKAVFVISVIPIVLFKNGLRIFVLSVLAIYVDRGFLTGWLHQAGGFLFYILGLLLLLPIMEWLRRRERRTFAPAILGPAALCEVHGVK